MGINELTKFKWTKAQLTNFLKYMLEKKKTSIEQNLIKIQTFENKVQKVFVNFCCKFMFDFLTCKTSWDKMILKSAFVSSCRFKTKVHYYMFCVSLLNFIIIHIFLFELTILILFFIITLMILSYVCGI
jgi:hypothetical protein